MDADQRRQRMNIRNAYLIADTSTITAARDRFRADGDEWSAECLQEMLDECEKHAVDNFGDTPSF